MPITVLIFRPRWRALTVAITFASLFGLFEMLVRAQEVNSKLIAPLRILTSSEGSRIKLTSDAPLNDYAAYRHGDEFSVVLPYARTYSTDPSVYGHGLRGVRSELRGNDLVIIFRMESGAAARVEQSFNRLDVVITGRNAKSDGASSSRVEGASMNTPAPSMLSSDEIEAPNGINSPSSSTLFIPSVNRAPQLKDFLDDRPREAETSVTNFRQSEPGDGIPASRKTTAYLSYDDKNFYVIFVCLDEPDKVRAHLAKREDISGDDTVSLSLDTFHDQHRAYTFVANPLGVQLDSINTEGQGSDSSFDTLWHSEGVLTSYGYVVRMAIPFKSLRFSGTPVQTWGIALGRSIQRNNERSYYPYITERVQGFVPQMAKLEGLERISPGRNIQLTPYGFAGRGRFLEGAEQGGAAIRTKNESRIGMDAKIVVRDAITLDLTINPDFSQVESDEPQVTANQRFEVFFPEKRPFFLENASFFQTPENLFFSRRIVNPQFGARLTGKIGRWAVGGLVIDDRAQGKLLLESDPLHDQRAVVGAFRIEREFGEQSSAGFLVTSRDFASSSNRVFSFDTRLHLNQNWTFSGQIMRSYTKGLDGRRFSGPAYMADLSRSGRNLNYSVRYTDRSPNFRSDMGFIPRVDVRQVEQFFNYDWRPGGKRVTSFGPTGYTFINWDRQGHLQDWFANAGFGVQLTGQTSLEASRSESYERFEGHDFRTHSTDFSLHTQWLEWLTLSASYGQGTSVNFFPSAELAPFTANSIRGQLGFTVRPTARFAFDQTYLYSRLGTQEGIVLFGSYAARSIFNNHVLRSKLSYQFTRALSVRAILDYDSLIANSSLIGLEPNRRLAPDILLVYLLNPGTAVYIGFSDRYENVDLASTNLRTGSPTISTGRQFFVKLSYQLRY